MTGPYTQYDAEKPRDRYTEFSFLVRCRLLCTLLLLKPMPNSQSSI